MQHTVNLNGGDGCALNGRQQNTAQSIAQRKAKAALQRFCNNACVTGRVMSRNDFQFGRLDEFLPVFFITGFTLVSGVGSGALDATAFGRTAAIMRDRRYITNGGDGKTRSLQCPQRAFTARTGSAHMHFQCFHAMFHGFCRHLRRRHWPRKG
ncbi:MAG: hypothetical protein CM15mP21_6570 [Hyphomicrobiales bacterium]|nr:MAG: hypothetical protein CM15mP21_6570 [Hyphomicrobiales bacterium]